MSTYQDFLKIGDNEQDRIQFVRDVITDHKASADYKLAQIGND